MADGGDGGLDAAAAADGANASADMPCDANVARSGADANADAYADAYVSNVNLRIQRVLHFARTMYGS